MRQRLAKQPYRGGIRHQVLEFQIKKAHERYAVADQVLSLLVREIVQRLQYHDLELQDRVIGLATGVALALLALRLRYRLDRLQWITLGADHLQPALKIKEALLPNASSPPSGAVNETDSQRERNF